MWVLQTLVAALLLPGTPTRASSQQRVPASPRCEVAPEVAPKEKKILLPVFPEGRRQFVFRTRALARCSRRLRGVESGSLCVCGSVRVHGHHAHPLHVRDRARQSWPSRSGGANLIYPDRMQDDQLSGAARAHHRAGGVRGRRRIYQRAGRGAEDARHSDE